LILRIVESEKEGRVVYEFLKTLAAREKDEIGTSGQKVVRMGLG
jgi:hypothetical protein